MISRFRKNCSLGTVIAMALMTVVPAYAEFDSGSDGTDGVFNPLVDIEIDLATAPTGVWTDAGGDVTADGVTDGVYDPDQWAVVFKYASIDIPAGVTVTFSNHPSGAPVIWLSQGDVTIAGTVDVSGKDGSPDRPFAQGGPGGFAGGNIGSGELLTNSSGLGPGGGNVSTNGNGTGASHATIGLANNIATYGNLNVLPLIGGSGGAGHYYNGWGGGGGGAIMIAANTILSITGSPSVIARGGNALGSNSGSGSGGTIRLIAPIVAGDASTLIATGNIGGLDGGLGRIRIDADDLQLTGPTSSPSFTTDNFTIPVFPPATYPTLRATMVDSESVPADPIAGIDTVDVSISNATDVVLAIEATDIPVGTTVIVHVIPGRGGRYTVNSTPLADAGGGLLTATATIPNFPAGRVEIQLRAAW